MQAKPNTINYQNVYSTLMGVQANNTPNDAIEILATLIRSATGSPDITFAPDEHISKIYIVRDARVIVMTNYINVIVFTGGNIGVMIAENGTRMTMQEETLAQSVNIPYCDSKYLDKIIRHAALKMASHVGRG